MDDSKKVKQLIELENKYDKGLWTLEDMELYSFLLVGNGDAMLTPESYLSY